MSEDKQSISIIECDESFDQDDKVDVTSTNKGISYYNRIKTVDPMTQSIVYGFIRRIEQILSRDMTIPSDIVSMCLLYYFNPEYFTVHGKRIILRDNHQTINFNAVQDTELTQKGGTAYGNLEINNNDYVECSWTFKVNKYNTNDTIGIGIDSSEKIDAEYMFYHVNINDFFHRLLSSYNKNKTAVTDDNTATRARYAYETGRNFARMYVYGNNPTSYGCALNVDDVITMELDIQNKTLRYFVNSKDQGIAVQNVKFDDVNKSYVMAVYSDGETEIKLIKFQAKYK